MNKLNIERNKHYSETCNNKDSEAAVVAQVTKCLATHQACTGRYIDFSR